MYETLKLTKNLAPTQLNVNGKIITDPEALANEFNKTFVNKVNERLYLNGTTTNPTKILLLDWY